MASRSAQHAMFVAGLAMVFSILAVRPCRADEFEVKRNEMVDKEIVGAGIKDPRVIKSMRETPRHEFVDIPKRQLAYYDMAIEIGNAQTISPPFIVAYMTEQLLPKPTDIVLEIGTGSGYQAAVLSPLVKEVYSIEIVKPLGDKAARTLKRLKYANVFTKVGDGYQGWPEHAPFDKIIVTCSPEDVPQKLVEQLREGGRMLVPVGERYRQTLYLFQKQDGQLNKVALLPMLFVPMTGQAEEGRVILPDPARPSIENGGFEEIARAGESASGTPASTDKADELAGGGWYYQRQLKLMEAPDAPEGRRYVTFRNAEPGRGAVALHGLAVDGRKVRQLDVSMWVKASNLRPGATNDQLASVAITFYDQNRARAGFELVGPWHDSFGWKQVKDTVRVPPNSREAIVCIGLSGATGEISFDDIRIGAAK